MQIFANVKSLRRERGFLESKSYELPHDVRTLRDLIIVLVDVELSAYNRREPGEMLKALLSQDEIDQMGWKNQEGNSLADHVYCKKTQRTITSRIVMNGANSFVAISASKG